MAVLVNIVSDYAGWIYAACAVAALFLLRTAILARKERRQAAFTLERETATNRTPVSYTHLTLPTNREV